MPTSRQYGRYRAGGTAVSRNRRERVNRDPQPTCHTEPFNPRTGYDILPAVGGVENDIRLKQKA
jgi:hypothetical protein